ncbi:MAG: hypothetical protein ABFC63_12300 [Thermoguttaceae bacterium]
MNFTLIAMLFAGGLFLSMLLCLEIGRICGTRQVAKHGEKARLGLGAVEGAVFALLGLLIAFTFSGAVLRFDSRRQMVVDEANAVGTAYLRLDLLPADKQPALRGSFRRYLDSRLTAYRKLPDIAAAMTELARSKQLQSEIWTRSVAACQQSSSPSAAMLLLPALNQMFDITTTRTMATQLHPPAIVFVMLAVVTLAGSLLAGYGMAGASIHSWVHTLAFAAILSTTTYVILDIEYPRLGLVRVDAFDKALSDLRQSIPE